MAFLMHITNVLGRMAKGIPCSTKDCGHISRDHDRSRKQPDGSWNGKCDVWDCNCELYRKPKNL